jgi:AraC-like DNA-binding protein
MARSSSRREADSLGFSVWLGVMTPMARYHVHADIELNYLFSGTTRYFIGDRFIDLPAGRLAAFWAAIPHHVVAASPGCEFGWVTIPLAWFLRYDIGQAALGRLLAGALVLEPRQRPADGELMRQWAADIASRDPGGRATCALEVQARVRRLLAAPQPPAEAPAGAGGGGPAGAERIEAITGWIGRHYQEDIRLATIGREVGLHPNYAMSLFRAGCGMSIWRYVTRLRLAHAQRLLVTTRRTTLAIALDSGFGSLARFYEVFAREVGMPPGEFRRRQGQTGP